MIPWEEIREEYIHGSCSQRALAHKYGVSPASLSRHAVKEAWVEQRREHYLQQRIQEGLDPMGEYWLDGVRDAANTLTEVIRRSLLETQEAGFSPDKEERSREKGFPKKSLGEEMLKWTGVIRELAAVMRSLYGVPGYVEREQLRLQEKKIDADGDKRSAADKEGADGRVFMPVTGEIRSAGE